MHVVATAGHVDHGKSTLVRALTGQEPDRLAEEHRRGLSIELGYCWTEIGASQVAFVDVPGHERFVTTMLAGVGPVPVVVFVLAADDDWMPQAAEHLTAIDALGIDHGVVAVTRCDLAHPRAIRERAQVALRGTSLESASVVEVSAATGVGLSALRSALGDVLARVPPPDPGADVRLWVDRVFSLPGAGTVVTGTLPAGTVSVGDVLTLGEEEVRVRGIELLGRPAESASGVARVALRIGSGAPAELRRGVALTSPAAWHRTMLVDVRVRRAGEGLPHELTVHIGSASVPCRTRPLDRQGTLVRLSLARALPLRVGERCVLRDPGSHRLWGALVLDPAPPPMDRRGAAARRADDLVAASEVPDLREELRRRGVVRRSLLRRIGVPPEPLAGHGSGEWVIDPAHADALSARLRQLVGCSVTDAPLGRGLTLAAAARALDLPDPTLVQALVRPPVTLVDGRLRLEGDDLPAVVRRGLDQLRQLLSERPFAVPGVDELARLGLDSKALAAAARAGRLLRLDEHVAVLPGAEETALDRLRGLPQPFTTSQARQALETSRRVALPLLEHLDRIGATRRLPDDRRQVQQRSSDALRG